MRRERREEILVILMYMYTVILYKYANWNEAHTAHVQCVCVCVSCCNSYCNYSRGLMWINYSLQLMFHEGICLYALGEARSAN